MEKEAIVQMLIDKVSAVYRQQREKANKTKKLINEIQEKLKDTNMPYKEFMNLQDNLSYLEIVYEKESNIASGMELAREELLSEL